MKRRNNVWRGPSAPAVTSENDTQRQPPVKRSRQTDVWRGREVVARSDIVVKLPLDNDPTLPSAESVAEITPAPAVEVQD